MMKISITLISLLGIVSSSLFAQEGGTGTGQQDVLDLTGTAIRIERRVEMPRVSIFNKRIKPEFSNIAVNKTFTKEVMGKNEEIKFNFSSGFVVKPIKNTEKLVNKKR